MKATRAPVVNDRIERFDYSFDKSLIATAPMKPRDASRLLVYDRKTETISHQQFSSILNLLRPNDLLIVNNTRVFPARLHAYKEKMASSVSGQGGGKIELLLLKEVAPLHWEAMVKGHITTSTVLTLNGGGQARMVKELDGGRKIIAFELPNQSDLQRPGLLYAYLEKWGEVPLPPYILQRRKDEGLTDKIDVGASPNSPAGNSPMPPRPALARAKPAPHYKDADSYQTVYAKPIGSAAAPTAGLHFTKQLIAALRRKGVAMATVTLNIGIDTFNPIGADRLSHHKMSGESFEVSSKTANAIAKTKASGGRVIAVGTSATRSIESAANSEGTVMPTKAKTELFISPGYTFRAVDGLITNFHPPRATGLVLVSAFLGYNATSRLYCEALEKRYRLFSYGDAMLIL